jgi:hypothetical protein
MSRVVIKSSFIWGAIKLALHMEQHPNLRLNRTIRPRVKLVLNLLLISSKYLKNKPSMTHVPQPSSLESKSQGLKKKDPKSRGMDYAKN